MAIYMEMAELLERLTGFIGNVLHTASVDLFEEILRLSLYGTIAGFGVMLVSLLIDRVRAPRWISLTLWGLVALRLVCPYSVSSSISLLGLGNISTQIESALDFKSVYTGDYKKAEEGTELYGKATAAGSPISRENEYGRLSAYYYERENGRIEPAKTVYETWLPKAGCIWLTGVAALWLWAMISYIRLKHKLQFAIKADGNADNVYEAELLPSPCVVGIIKPRIYLLPGLPARQKAHIILHEQMHIRYFDPLWKIISFLIASLHWFNPMLWILYGAFQGELEKACDERVLARLGEGHREDYGESLLALARERKWKLPTPISFGEEGTKGRIQRILRYRKPLMAVSVLAVILAAVVCGVFLTVPASNLETETLSEVAMTAETQMLSENEQDTNIGNFEQSLSQDSQNTPSDMGASQNNPKNDDDGNGEDAVNNNDVYEELADGEVVYQAKRNGIYRVKDGRQERIYQGFAGVSPHMAVFEGRLYFMVDTSYEEEQSLDWADNAILWVNLDTLEEGALPLDFSANPLLSDFYLNDGILTVWYGAPEKVSVTMLYHKGETVFQGKGIEELSTAEGQQFGMQVTQEILRGKNALVNVSNRVRGQNIAYVDLDGNGTAEKIMLRPSPSHNPSAFDQDEPLQYYQLQIGEAFIEGYSENMANTLWVVNLNGSLLLAVYEDGPSADPSTRFYRYADGQIIEAGAFEEDIRFCEILSDGTISGSLRKEIVQTDWIQVRWQLDGNGSLSEIPQETYDFMVGNFVKLHEELPLHIEIGGTETFTVQPQNVKFLKTSADWSWVLVETQNGQQGWVHIEDFEVVELRKNVMDVFDGRYLAG